MDQAPRESLDGANTTNTMCLLDSVVSNPGLHEVDSQPPPRELLQHRRASRDDPVHVPTVTRNVQQALHAIGKNIEPDDARSLMLHLMDVLSPKQQNAVVHALQQRRSEGKVRRTHEHNNEISDASFVSHQFKQSRIHGDSQPSPCGRPVMQWSTEDVGVWLEHIGLGAYRTCFASLNGRMLLTLKNDEQLRAVLALPVPLSLDTQAYKPVIHSKGEVEADSEVEAETKARTADSVEQAVPHDRQAIKPSPLHASSVPKMPCIHRKKLLRKIAALRVQRTRLDGGASSVSPPRRWHQAPETSMLCNVPIPTAPGVERGTDVRPRPRQQVASRLQTQSGLGDQIKAGARGKHKPQLRIDLTAPIATHPVTLLPSPASAALTRQLSPVEAYHALRESRTGHARGGDPQSTRIAQRAHEQHCIGSSNGTSSNGGTADESAHVEHADTEKDTVVPHGKRKKGGLRGLGLAANLRLDLRDSALASRDDACGGVSSAEKSYDFTDDGTLRLHGFRIKDSGIAGTPDGTPWHQFRAPQETKDCLVILDELGQGAAGRVYKALYVPTLKLVALKVFRVHDEGRRKQLVSELLAARSSPEGLTSRGQSAAYVACAGALAVPNAARPLSAEQYELRGAAGVMQDCPHLVSYFDAFCDQQKGTVSIVLEFMDAGTLQDLISANVRCNERVLASIALSCLRGLHFIHTKMHKLHRDIKASNILISKNGDVKISDFGLAKDLDCTADLATTFIGTLLYMSPERVAGKSYSFASDIWSLGLTLFACAVGKFPLPVEEGYWGVVHAVQTLPPPSLAEHGSFSTELCDFIGLCLKKDPSQRPTAATLLEHPFIVANYVPPVKKEPPSGGCPSPAQQQMLKDMAARVRKWRQSRHARKSGEDGPALRSGTSHVRSSCDAPQIRNAPPRIRLSNDHLQSFADQLGVSYEAAFNALKDDYKFEPAAMLRKSSDSGSLAATRQSQNR